MMANKVYEHEGALIAYGKRLDEIEQDIVELKEIVGHYHRETGNRRPRLGTRLGEKVANLEAKVANLTHGQPEKSWADKSVTTRDVLWMCGTALVAIGVFILWGIMT